MDTSTRLRIATRIHFALLRQYGEHVEIGILMQGGADAREAMFVCEASGDTELATLARRLRHADRAEAKAPTAKPAPQETPWADNTTGFGISRPLELDDAAASSGHWLSPSTWLRRAAAAKPH